MKRDWRLIWRVLLNLKRISIIGIGARGALGMLKTGLKHAINRLGFDLRRYTPGSQEDSRFMRNLAKRNVNVIFDIGANVGQFGAFMRVLGYKGRIVSFEPIAGAHEELLERTSCDPLWDVAPRAALGDGDGEVELHVSENSVSSSLLNMLNSHLAAAPNSLYVRNEKVPLCRLDTIGPQYLEATSVPFIKIDAQGYEAQVLSGAPLLLTKAVGVRVEMSLVPLYEGQALWDEMIAGIKKNGFELWDIAPAFVNAQTDRLLQIDATLFRGGA